MRQIKFRAWSKDRGQMFSNEQLTISNERIKGFNSVQILGKWKSLVTFVRMKTY